MRRKEIWKDIAGYESLYQVSNYGKVNSVRSNKILKPSLNKQYYAVVFSVNKKRKTYKVHRLVGLHFVKGYKPNLQINHKKGNKLDNRAWMLEWNTCSENNFHRCRVLGHSGKGGPPKKKVKQLSKKGKIIKTYKSITEASIKTGIEMSQISGCAINKYGYKTAGGFKWKL